VLVQLLVVRHLGLHGRPGVGSPGGYGPNLDAD
jgi:hypothetical protein